MTPTPSSEAVRGVYAIVHRASGRVYVGCSADVRKRWRWHTSMLGLGRHPSRQLLELWRRDGRGAFSFVLLEVVPKRTALKPRETEWMYAYRGKLLNAMAYNRHGAAARAAMGRAARAAWDARHEAGTDQLDLAARLSVAEGTRRWARRPEVLARKRQLGKLQGAKNLQTPEARRKNAQALRGQPKSAAHRAALKAAHSNGTCRCHPRRPSIST